MHLQWKSREPNQLTMLRLFAKPIVKSPFMFISPIHAIVSLFSIKNKNPTVKHRTMKYQELDNSLNKKQQRSLNEFTRYFDL